MRTLWLKIWVGAKLAVAALLVIYVITFVAENSGEHVTFWIWFGKRPDTTVFKLALFAFLGGVVLSALTATAFRTYRQVKELKKRNQEQRDRQTLAKAASLVTKPPTEEKPTPMQ